jgi:hypothetical protein
MKLESDTPLINDPLLFEPHPGMGCERSPDVDGSSNPPFSSRFNTPSVGWKLCPNRMLSENVFV